MIIRFLYTLLLIIVCPFFLYALYKGKENKPKFGKRWVEHFGFSRRLKDNNATPLWIHTVSVGEAIAATPLIRALKKQNPQQTIVVTTTTSTGAAQIQKLGDLVEHRYMPLDFSFAVKNFIRRINPSALLIMETELWPNTLHTLNKYNIPVTIINARLSERSYLRYLKFQFIFNLLSKNISQLLCQTAADAQRFILLGVDKQKVHITGSIKFDISISPEAIKEGEKLKNSIPADTPVWIAASTHKGEDEKILEAHKLLRDKIPEALLILVPRHPERFSSVKELCKSQGFNVLSRTGKQDISESTSVYIGDTMGEMLSLITAADICFMGGSLIGEKVGGHNLLEPAALAKPCLTGPSFYNFQIITEQLIAEHACIVCQSAEDIASNLIALFSDKARLQQMGMAALKVVNKNKGALNSTLQHLDLL